MLEAFREASYGLRLAILCPGVIKIFVGLKATT